MANQTWEELRNSNGVLHKLTARLSYGKEVSITLVPKTKLVYMHLNDNSKAYKSGSFDKSMSKSVSLSMAEVMILRSLMSTMEPKVSELASICGQLQGRKRKHQGEDLSTSSAAAEAMLTEFNSFQGQQPFQAQCGNEGVNNNQQQYYAVPQFHQAKQPRLQQPLANSQPSYAMQQHQQPPPAYQQIPASTSHAYGAWGQTAMPYDTETFNSFDCIN